MENKEVYKYIKQHIGNESKETIWDNAKVIYEQLTDQEKKKNIYISTDLFNSISILEVSCSR